MAVTILFDLFIETKIVYGFIVSRKTIRVMYESIYYLHGPCKNSPVKFICRFLKTICLSLSRCYKLWNIYGFTMFVKRSTLLLFEERYHALSD